MVPSFLYLEPFRNDETVGICAMALAGGGIVAIVFGLLSALWAWWKTLRIASSCARNRQFRFESGISAVEISAPNPVILVAGIWCPTFFISRQARELLDHREMQMAIQHEMAHIRFRDNLKKLMLRLCRFPFLSELERRWVQAAEFAADDAAARDESSALDLASALLKIATGPNPAQMPVIAMGLVTTSDSALHERIERLLAWQPSAGSRCRRSHPGPMTVFILALLIATYVPLLGQVHELTELLVR
jgi:beta-lactamase regulating signal transducer with metallopeptidase domain